jgi:hypothetical protein
VRLATISTAAGPRLHVLGRSGYVDVGEATGDPRFASLRSFLEAGRPAMDAARGLAGRTAPRISGRLSRLPTASCAWV